MTELLIYTDFNLILQLLLLSREAEGLAQ